MGDTEAKISQGLSRGSAWRLNRSRARGSRMRAWDAAKERTGARQGSADASIPRECLFGSQCVEACDEDWGGVVWVNENGRILWWIRSRDRQCRARLEIPEWIGLPGQS